jgi:GT2 family glycosyltransferase
MPQPSADEISALRVSVVICTHNGAHLLPTVLGALAAQRLAGAELEIVVIADHCEDDSERVAVAAGARVYPVIGDGGLAAARNTGIERSTGEIIAFTDDDCAPEPDWVAELVRPFAEDGVAGVGGRTVPASDAGLAFSYITARNPLMPLPAVLLNTDPIFRLRTYLRTGQGPTKELETGTELYSVTGANMAFRRRLLEALGGFDPRIRFGGEEEELCRRAHAADASVRFVYTARALVRHHFRPGLSDVLRRSRAYGRGNARAAIDNPQVAPIVYPFPLLWLLALALARRRGLTAALFALALPSALYARWLPYALRSCRPLALGFPYIQAAQETTTMVGELEHWFRARRG